MNKARTNYNIRQGTVYNINTINERISKNNLNMNKT